MSENYTLAVTFIIGWVKIHEEFDIIIGCYGWHIVVWKQIQNYVKQVERIMTKNHDMNNHQSYEVVDTIGIFQYLK